jgi:hypothetical protein
VKSRDIASRSMNYQDRSGSRIILGEREREREREEAIYKSSISKREVRLWGVGEDFNASLELLRT